PWKSPAPDRSRCAVVRCPATLSPAAGSLPPLHYRETPPMAEQRPRLPRLAEQSRTSVPVDYLLKPFGQLARMPTLGGGLLVAVTLVAMIWANSPWAESYRELLNTKFAVGSGEAPLNKPLILWINDLLMGLFFLLVGLEIKREAMVGELRSIRKAALPLVAAAGGMAIPGLIYFAVNATAEGGAPRGWGVSVATDIAFALGLLALLGRRIPAGIRVFLATLAIADDIGALLVIALFYTEQLGYNWLMWAAAALLGLLMLNWSGVRNPGPYFLVGLALWYFTFKSGVHATIAGVLMAATIPATRRVNGEMFVAYCRSALDSFERARKRDSHELITGEEQAA